eukprot:Colp12_sorted_trinity150504_noHs@9629
MATSKRAVFAFATLFFAGVSGLCLSLMIFMSKYPWDSDETHMREVLNIKTGSIQEYFHQLDPTGSLEVFITRFYTIAIVSASLNSALILLIIFLASGARLLILAVQCTIAWAILILRFSLGSAIEGCVHYRLFATIFYLNLIGLVAFASYAFGKYMEETDKHIPPSVSRSTSEATSTEGTPTEATSETKKDA